LGEGFRRANYKDAAPLALKLGAKKNIPKGLHGARLWQSPAAARPNLHDVGII